MNKFKAIIKRIIRKDKLIHINTLLNSDGKVKLDLGGIGKGQDGWRTVNLIPGVDIQQDIINIDSYCEDDTVDMFKMSHTYEHIPIVVLDNFMNKLYKKLKKDGILIIIQTDIKSTLDLYKKRKIDFYCLRDIIFSPIDRRKESYRITSKDLQHHQFMWGVKELRDEILLYGFKKTAIFSAGNWKFDIPSIYPFQKNEKYFDVKVPNLGIAAYK